jgi:Ser/Thr protein kinase RdoA (MazF antagonist)
MRVTRAVEGARATRAVFFRMSQAGRPHIIESNDLMNFTTPLHCPSCDRTLEEVVVNPAGELIGCDTCADALGLAGESVSLAEWYAPDLVVEALSHYELPDARAGKPAAAGVQRPRLHYWEVIAGDRRYFLKRFQDWYPTPAIRYIHSILKCLEEDQLPTPRVVLNRVGVSFTEAADSRWALYCALDGASVEERDWMWGRPRAAETLATIHRALERFTPEGEAFAPWDAWTEETVDRVLESWSWHANLHPDLLGFVRDRLATRYFGELYLALPKQVVHGDFVLANVLWRGAGANATISGVLDFERAHRDTPLFDFAWGLGDRRPPLLRATVAAYTRARPLSALEREALPEAMLLGCLMAIDMQLMYFQNMREVARLGQDLAMIVRDLEALRKAVALRA